MKLTVKLIVAQGLVASGVILAGILAVYGLHITQLMAVLGILVVVALAMVGLGFFMFNRSITGQLGALEAAMSRIALGDLSQNVPVRSRDEIGTLTASFNSMTRQLRTAYQTLEEATREAKEDRIQLLASINSLRQGFILLDGHQGVVMANDVANEVVGHAPSGKHQSHHQQTQYIDDLSKLLPENMDLHALVGETLKNRQPAKYAGLSMHDSGRYFNLYLSPVVNEAEAIGCVLLLEDVTEERIIQRSRDEFFSIASHELRTPLTAIRGNTSMMATYFPELTKNADLMTMVNDIHDSTERLIEIVNDFLDTSSLEQNKMKFNLTAFALEPVIERIIYEMAGTSRDKKVQLTYDHTTTQTLPLVYGDQNRVTQVLYNLIGNAFKFTDQGSVLLNCIVTPGFIKVCVSDTGKGISPEGQQLLFHKFQQSTENILTRDSTRGTGLGLYISKLLMERMHGKIALEHSEVGKGSTFSITIPIAPEQPAAGKQTKAKE